MVVVVEEEVIIIGGTDDRVKGILLWSLLSSWRDSRLALISEVSIGTDEY